MSDQPQQQAGSPQVGPPPVGPQAPGGTPEQDSAVLKRLRKEAQQANQQSEANVLMKGGGP